jgi:hypothetical protein
MSLDIISQIHLGVYSVNGNMEPWNEPSSRIWYATKMELLQMEKEKVANKVTEEMMNRTK